MRNRDATSQLHFWNLKENTSQPVINLSILKT